MSVNEVLNWFTRDNPLAVSMLRHLNAKRPPSDKLTGAMHIGSKFIPGYRDLCDLVAVDNSGAELSMTNFVWKYRRPPSVARVDGCTIPIHGIEAVLAVAKLVADTDCLGGSFANTGFVIRRNAIGMPLSVRAAKIDAGFGFNFDGPENAYTKTFIPSPFPTGRKMKDPRDIQFGNNQTFDIEFEKLLPAQKELFMQTFEHGMQRLDKKFMTNMIWRKDIFKSAKVHVKRADVNKAVKTWSIYLSHLRLAYSSS